jgi:hypothetical protein
MACGGALTTSPITTNTRSPVSTIWPRTFGYAWNRGLDPAGDGAALWDGVETAGGYSASEAAPVRTAVQHTIV